MMFLRVKAVEYGGYFGAGVTEREVLVAVQDIARITQADDGTYIHLRDGETLFSRAKITELIEALDQAGLVVKL